MFTKQQPTVAIIIPTYSHFAYAELAIESAATTPGATILVIDDGSPDWPGERIIRRWIPPRVPFIIQRYDKNLRSLTRSWNTGLRLAKNLGIDYAVCANADVIFPEGWWPPMQDALRSCDFVGPLTNAPGHSSDQDITLHLPTYLLSDDPEDILHARRSLTKNPISTSRLNGFCLAGSVAAFHRLDLFSGSIPMEGNEDDFLRRAQSAHQKLAICRRSFVFHYRSVARGLQHPTRDRGALRLPTCTACAAVPPRPSNDLHFTFTELMNLSSR